MNFVLDSNMVSFIIDNNPKIIAAFDNRIQSTATIIACPVVWFEVRRGLLVKDARNKLRRFEALFDSFVWEDFTPTDWKLAADLWKHRRTIGQPIADADLLIAVFAIHRNAILVTDNEKDFANLGVTIENWNKKV